MLITGMTDVATSGLATLARAGRGIYTRPPAHRPEQPLQLYEFEACPYCRLVRDAMTELDLDAMVRPCPKGGRRFRPEVVELGGKEQFPFLVDPDTGQRLYESRDIIEYLFETYGKRPTPGVWRRHQLQVASSLLATIARRGRGRSARPSRRPDQPLELYSIESSPFARRVRETLCELELPYLLHNVGRTQLAESIPPVVRERLGLRVTPETANRKAFVARSGRMVVPYLIDPNTETAMFESTAIQGYLERTYGQTATRPLARGAIRR